MRFRRNRADAPDHPPDRPPESDDTGSATGSEDATEQPTVPGTVRGVEGPFDADLVDVPEEVYVDLGSLLIQPFEEAELRMQVDEDSGSVLALVLVGEQGALEVRAFAAPRNADLWSQTRHEIAADAAQRGGTADERSGPFGPELYCELPVTLDDGQSAVQPSRVIGINGPRWLLRATLLGQPAMDAETAGAWEDTIRAVVVRRGQTPLPPGEALPLTLPPTAQKVE